LGSAYRTFLKGLLALLPLIVTVYLLIWIAAGADSIFSTPLRSLGLYVPGAGIILVVILIYAVGLLVNSYLTRPFFSWLEDRADHTPIIRSIYSPIRDITKLFTRTAGSTKQRVVIVALQDLGIEAMGLITRDHFEDLPPGTIKPGHVTVFFPFSYGVGGVTAIVPRTHIRETNLPTEKAMQLAITGWIKAPTEVLEDLQS
jgi:uncharacterized membrane protein